LFAQTDGRTRLSIAAAIHIPLGVILWDIAYMQLSTLRGTANSKAAKDLQQAAILVEAVVERFPGAIEEALSALPKSAAQYLRRAVVALKSYLPAAAQAAWEVLQLHRSKKT
jgi:hypothetical protein